jgi:hypothetical protein
VRIDGLARELDAGSRAHHAARAVATGEIADPQCFLPPVGMREHCGDAIGILRERHELRAELDFAAEIGKPRAQDIERLRLQQHPHAGIGHVGRRLAPLDAMKLGRSERLRPVPGQRRRIRPTGAVHTLDEAEVVVDFQRARLDALAARAGAMIRRRGKRLDDAERHAAPREIAGEHEA